MPLAITVPELVGVKVTLQLDVVALTVVKLHGEPVNEPDLATAITAAKMHQAVMSSTAAQVIATEPTCVFCIFLS